MAVTAQAVKELRDQTGAGFKECQDALRETDGDVKAATDWLVKKGLKKAEKVTGREAKQGLVASYIHLGRIGAMIELSCETDFVARTDDFQTLAQDLAKQVSGVPTTEYVSTNDIPEEVLNAKKAEIGEEGLKRWYEETVLLNQAFIRDNKVSINDMIVQAKAKLGENIVIRRFVRYELGK